MLLGENCFVLHALVIGSNRNKKNIECAQGLMHYMINVLGQYGCGACSEQQRKGRALLYAALCRLFVDGGD